MDGNGSSMSRFLGPAESSRCRHFEQSSERDAQNQYSEPEPVGVTELVNADLVIHIVLRCCNRAEPRHPDAPAVADRADCCAVS